MFNFRGTFVNSFSLFRELKSPCKKMSGLVAFKTLCRPFICPLDLVLSQIPEGARLYDIGCGSGALLYLALKFRSVKIAHGYDVYPEAVKASAAFDLDPHKFRVIQIQPEETPPNLSGYDVVTMIDVLHHIPLCRQDDFIREVIKSMDKGAKLIIKDIEASRTLGAFFNQLHDLLLSRQWVHQRRSSDIVKVLHSTGLVVVSKPTLRWLLWYPHFQVLAQLI